MDYQKLLQKYKREIYNDIIIDGKVVLKGVRESKCRLDAILKVIPAKPIILDVGCHTGYFTTEIARHNKWGIIVGMEGNHIRAEIAGAVAEANKFTNVVILNNLMTADIANRWGNSCEAFTTILFLNVLHHIRIKDIEPIIQGATKLAPQLIIETPAKDETSACGTKNHRETILALEIPDYTKTLICETKTHTTKKKEIMRPMFMLSNVQWKQNFTRPHYYHSTAKKHKHRLEWDNQKFIQNGKKPWKPAVNLGTMVALNMVYPTKEKIMIQLRKIIDKHNGPLYDINLWNILLTPDNLELIDFSSRFEIRYTKSEAIEHISKQFDKLKREGAKPLVVQNLKNWIKHIVVSLLGRYKQTSKH